MDINKIIDDHFDQVTTSQKASTLSPGPTSNNADDEKGGKHKDALLAVKRDPAVLEAKVSIEDQGVSSNPQVTSRASKKSEASQTPCTPRLQDRLNFENKVRMDRAALLALPPSQFSLILKYVDILRKQRVSMQKKIECAFCRNNRRLEVWYTTHMLKDHRGRVLCPVLRSFVCPACGATGDRAHTISYCPRVRRR